MLSGIRRFQIKYLRYSSRMSSKCHRALWKEYEGAPSHVLVSFVDIPSAWTKWLYMIVVNRPINRRKEERKRLSACWLGEIEALCARLLPVIKTDARLLHCSFHQVALAEALAITVTIIVLCTRVMITPHVHHWLNVRLSLGRGDVKKVLQIYTYLFILFYYSPASISLYNKYLRFRTICVFIQAVTAVTGIWW